MDGVVDSGIIEGLGATTGSAIGGTSGAGLGAVGAAGTLGGLDAGVVAGTVDVAAGVNRSGAIWLTPGGRLAVSAGAAPFNGGMFVATVSLLSGGFPSSVTREGKSLGPSSGLSSSSPVPISTSSNVALSFVHITSRHR